jgi:hypothetical protein
MEPLLALLQHHVHDHGLLLGDLPSQRIICNAHVDDTAVFLNKSSSLGWLFKVLGDFADFSGLKVQIDKSFGICLNTSVKPDSILGLPFLGMGETRRYLGILGGLGDLGEVNWARAHDSILTRLRLATQKSMCEPCKARILQAILAPKFSFMATFFSPKASVIFTWEKIVWQFFWLYR